MFHLPKNAGTRDYELSSKVKAHVLISKEIILIKMISYRFEISVVYYDVIRYMQL